MSQEFRIERDSMGEVRVPNDKLYSAQTQRAVDNFGLSDHTIPSVLISALGYVKAAAAHANKDLGLLDASLADAIHSVALEIAANDYDDHFVVDVFQTGSGTSSNMNTNEVISTLCHQRGFEVHPNDHVNMGQSSNDVFPSAILMAGAVQVERTLLPAIRHLTAVIESKAQQVDEVVKTGRTHLMDAMPITMGQELRAWRQLLIDVQTKIEEGQKRLAALPLGGTAVGTGINTHPEFSERAIAHLSQLTGVKISKADNFFAVMSCPEATSELSASLRSLGNVMIKIANDLRWMNSGPLAGLGEIELQALQPGSSIMPGKVNPVIPEAVAMAGAQAVGADAAISVAVQSSSFQLNVMLPMIAHNLLPTIDLLSRACLRLADSAIDTFKVRTDKINESLERNPILVTALNARIGYDKAAQIAKQAYAEQRPIIDVALDNTDLSRDELLAILDPLLLTKGGNV